MKIIKKILLLSFIVFLLFLGLATVYIKLFGKAAVEKAVTSRLHKNFVLGSINYDFPFGFSASNVRLEGIFKSKTISAQLSPLAFLKSNIEVVFVDIVEPFVLVERGKDVKSNLEGLTVPTSAVNSANPSVKTLDIFIKKLFVIDGRVAYFQAAENKDYEIEVNNLQMNLENLYLPLKAQKTSFNFVGLLNQKAFPFPDGKLGGSGWIDWIRRDMEGHAIIGDPDGKMTLKARFISVNNDMSVDGELKLADMFNVPGQENKAPASLRDVLSTMDVGIGANFSFKTKMDDFYIESVNFHGNLLLDTPSEKAASPSEN